jgi:hypothetical protein
MNVSSLRKGMIVDYHHDPVEILSFDHASHLVEIRRMNSQECLTANCDDLTEDPQLHTDCQSYY